MAIKKGDFVELDYTGKIADTGEVFDTTIEQVAKDNNLFEEGQTYGSAIVCVGESQLVKGLDSKLIGKDAGDHSFRLTPEEAFGKKSAKLIQLIPTNKFKQQGMQPVPGLQLNIDGVVGTVKAVSGGRTIVDFNHPLSGKAVSYDVSIKRAVKDTKEQIQSFVEKVIPDFKLDVAEKKATITTKEDTPKDVQTKLKEKLVAVTAVDDIAFAKE